MPTPFKEYLLPVVVARSVKWLVSSTQAEPFQYSDEPVALPLPTEPLIDNHLVEVPVLERY